MKKIIFTTILISFIFVSSFTVIAQVKVDSIQILEYGIYKSQIKEKLKANETVEGTWTLIEKVVLVTKTDSIPAKVGTQFGFWYKVNGEPEGEEITLLFKNKLPGLKNPAKEEIIHEEKYANKIKIGTSGYKGYVFEFDWETVPGKWTFEIFYKDKKLAEQSFIIFKAND